MRLLQAAKLSMFTHVSMLKSIEQSWANKMTKTSINKSCIICGTTNNLHMHHLTPIKDLKNKTKLDFFTRQSIAINRKQVPLCRDHHLGFHRGTLCDRDKELYVVGWKEYKQSKK